MTYHNDWKFIAVGLMQETPSEFFYSLHLSRYDGIAELSDLDGVLQHPKFHPEGDAFIHVMCCIDAAAKMGLSLKERYAVLCHDLGKRKAFDVNRANHKQHLGKHDVWGVPFVEAMSKRLGAPDDYKEFAVQFAKHHTRIHILPRLTDDQVFEVFRDFGLTKHNTEMLQEIVNCATSDARGRGPEFENMDHPCSELLFEKAKAYIKNI